MLLWAKNYVFVSINSRDLVITELPEESTFCFDQSQCSIDARRWINQLVTSLTKTRYCIFRERRGYCSRESGKIVYWLFFQRICWKNSLGLKKKKINMIPVTRPTLNNPKFRVGPPKNEKKKKEQKKKLTFFLFYLFYFLLNRNIFHAKFFFTLLCAQNTCN